VSKRSQRFRATVEVPEIGAVEVRGLSPQQLAAIPVATPTSEEIAAANHENPHPAYVAVIVAGCVRPRLSETDVLQLPGASRELLSGAIMRGHPATRRMAPKARSV
jgi:hypothetical protein